MGVALVGLAGASLATDLGVDISISRDQNAISAQTDAAVRSFAKRAAILTRRARSGDSTPFSLPMRLFLSRNGVPLPNPTTRGRGADITLVFDATGPNAFPPDYRTFLQSVYQRAKPILDGVFGTPSIGGVVKVSNYDADIGDRDAVAGGYYVPNNGSAQQEIRFPVYIDSVGFKLEVTAVNFIHTLLLAYMGPNSFGTDAFDEGLVRAATMRICRTPAAMITTLDPDLIEAALQSTYDIGSFYDWNNQRPLGGQKFIAPNLRTQPLPIGGSVGGPYLLRYQMAGTAWQKVLVEHPSFAVELTTAFYGNPGNYLTVPQQINLCQTILNRIGNGTVEGLTFTEWFKRQYILDTKTIPGTKVIVQPFPIIDGLAGNDFGVFGIQAHYFSVDLNGNETLLNNTAYPIFWTPEFFRLFTSAQDERMDIFSAYGAVAPNFPGDLFANEPYRVVVDIPVQDQNARCVLPAGAIATAARPNPNMLYGTVSGGLITGDYKVNMSFGAIVQNDIPVRNFAFGTTADPLFLLPQKVTLQVTRNGQVVMTRRVNKGPGSLGVDLRIGGDAMIPLPGGLKKGVQMIGLPGDPFAGKASDIFNLADIQTQAARWNGAKGRYEFFPESGAFDQGLGFFVRSDTTRSLETAGRVQPLTPISVALRPGWNMVSTPHNEVIPVSQVRVLVAANTPIAFNDAKGTSLGTEFYAFQPGANDTASGAPEGGTMVPATNFEPGKAYFVRVFAPQGLSLVFFPAGSSGAGRIGGGFSPMAPTNSWEMNVGLAGASERTDVRIGQHPAGTRSFDRSIDSELPPAFGGLQGSSQSLYRDIRKIGVQDTFQVKFDSLRPGTLYTVRFDRVSGTIGMFHLRDQAANVRKKYTGGGVYTFRATTKSRILSLGFNGAQP